MHRQTLVTLILSLLLVATGFILGQFYTSINGVPVINSLPFYQDEEEGLDEREEEREITLLSANNDQYFSAMNRALDIPQELDTLRLLRVVEGEDALEESMRFLGGSDAIKSVTIPYYVSGNSQATVWVIETHTIEEAGRILERMNYRLSDSDLFYNHGCFAQNDLTVHLVEGFNMHNYFYQRDNFIFWMSIVSEEPDEIMGQLFHYF